MIIPVEFPTAGNILQGYFFPIRQRSCHRHRHFSARAARRGGR